MPKVYTSTEADIESIEAGLALAQHHEVADQNKQTDTNNKIHTKAGLSSLAVGGLGAGLAAATIALTPSNGEMTETQKDVGLAAVAVGTLAAAGGVGGAIGGFTSRRKSTDAKPFETALMASGWTPPLEGDNRYRRGNLLAIPPSGEQKSWTLAVDASSSTDASITR